MKNIHDLSDLMILDDRQIGKQFEDDICWVLKKKNPTAIKRQIGTNLDTKEGTDFLYQALRIDATTDFHGKDNMPFVTETNIPATRWQNFQIGIRLGNSHHGYTEFPEPVVVLGLSMDARTYRQHQDEIIENLDVHADELMFAATDAYLDYTTTDKEEREELFSQPLQPNPSYSPPETLGDRYKRLNLFQEETKHNGTPSVPDF